MYNFMGRPYKFGGTGVFHFFAFMHSFQNLVSDFGDFQPYTDIGISIWNEECSAFPH